MGSEAGETGKSAGGERWHAQNRAPARSLGESFPWKNSVNLPTRCARCNVHRKRSADQLTANALPDKPQGGIKRPPGHGHANKMSVTSEDTGCLPARRDEDMPRNDRDRSGASRNLHRHDSMPRFCSSLTSKEISEERFSMTTSPTGTPTRRRDRAYHRHPRDHARRTRLRQRVSGGTYMTLLIQVAVFPIEVVTTF